MIFLDLVKARQSDRLFDNSRVVEAEKLNYILEAARLSPSACNAQPWSLIVVDDLQLVEALGDASASFGMNKFAKEAPIHLLLVEESANITSRIGARLKGKYYPLMDIGILAAHITLAAESIGLGSCILGWFDEKKVKRILSIPKKKRVLLDIVIGYSLAEKRDKTRKKLKDIVHYNGY